MPDLSTEELAALASAAEKATSGPWHSDEGFGGVWVVTGGPNDYAVHPSAKEMPGVVLGGSYSDSYKDADYIALCSPDRVAALVAEVQRLRVVEHTFRKMVEDGHPDSPEWFAIASNVLNNAAGGGS